jgi:hypothetical protein
MFCPFKISTGLRLLSGGSHSPRALRGVLSRAALPAASLSPTESASAKRVVLIAGHHQLR